MQTGTSTSFLNELSGNSLAWRAAKAPRCRLGERVLFVITTGSFNVSEIAISVTQSH